MFGGLLDETVQSIHVYGKDIDILDSFPYLGSVAHNNGGSRQEVLWWIGLAHDVYGLAQHEYLVLSVPVLTDRDSNLQIASYPCLTLWLRHEH